MRITVLLICLLFHLIFVTSVFGEGFILTCPRDKIEKLPVKFKFSKNKKTSWTILDEVNTDWFKLITKQTESYYILGGLEKNVRCQTNKGLIKKPEYTTWTVPFHYLIDRQTLKLYKKVTNTVSNVKCYYSNQKTYFNGEDFETFMNPCNVSKTKF